MEDTEMKEFSLTAFFLVTGISFLFFSKMLQWLDGNRLPVLTWIGIIAITIGSLTSIVTLLTSIMTIKGRSEEN